jgi:catechol 2,3-dioxygenase-like lactoylglutathione lyase family enzyme
MSTAPGSHRPFPMMFHPTLVVDNLDESAEWFRRVFCRTEVRWEDKWNIEWLNPSYPINYSYFFVLGDVSLDVLCPSLLVLPGDRKAIYPKGEGLVDIAWFTDHIEEVSALLERHGFRTRDQEGQLIHEGKVPESSLVADCPMIWTLPQDTGLTYEFYRMAPRHWPKYSMKADPRLAPGWQPDQPVPGDPLGIVGSAFHTIHTRDLARARRLYVEVLGAELVSEGHEPDIDADVLTVRYAKSVLKFATPRNGVITDVLSGAPTDADQYTGITFRVLDVEAVARHLEAQGVPFRRLGPGIVTEPAGSKGAAWGFVPA